MPKYVFRCNRCGEESEIIKPVKAKEDKEFCQDCGLQLEDITAARFTGGMKPDIFTPQWNPALGKVFTGNGQIKEELRRIKGETGRELIEVGNENVKPRRREYKLDRDMVRHDYRKALKEKWR